MGFVERYPREVVQAAQICGARATRDHFFPEWKVVEFYLKGLVQVVPLDDDSRRGQSFTVTVQDPTQQRKETMTIYSRSKEKED